MDYTMTEPCDSCPFRFDINFCLSVGRVQEIVDSGSFSCHKTTMEGGSNGNNEQSCAGLMILLEKIGQPNQMMRIAERLGMYNFHKLNMDAPVFNTILETIQQIEK